jgi:hypothetical protein
MDTVKEQKLNFTQLKECSMYPENIPFKYFLFSFIGSQAQEKR